MAYEHKNNTFTMFKNEGKEKETQPDFTGQGKINEKDVEIAGWKKIKQDENGNTKAWMSLQLNELEQQQTQIQEPQSEIDIEDIPF